MVLVVVNVIVTIVFIATIIIVATVVIVSGEMTFYLKQKLFWTFLFFSKRVKARIRARSNHCSGPPSSRVELMHGQTINTLDPVYLQHLNPRFKNNTKRSHSVRRQR